MSVCASCRCPMQRAETALRERVAGRQFELKVTVESCPECGEELIGSDEVKRFELHVARELALHGPPSGEAFRFMRKALGMPAVQVARLLGLRPETVSRWERGKLQADPRSVVLLGSIVLDAVQGTSTTIDRLEALCA